MMGSRVGVETRPVRRERACERCGRGLGADTRSTTFCCLDCRTADRWWYERAVEARGGAVEPGGRKGRSRRVSAEVLAEVRAELDG